LSDGRTFCISKLLRRRFKGGNGSVAKRCLKVRPISVNHRHCEPRRRAIATQFAAAPAAASISSLFSIRGNKSVSRRRVGRL
jgi:hypothetical protein